MSRYTGPKDRLSRQVGIDLFGKGSKLRRLNIPPGVHGPKGAPLRPSEYSKQLKEKQKLKTTYGLMEKQFRRYFNQASKHKANTGEILLQLLERRLDNVVHRLGLASNRNMARQLVTHGHVQVDGKKVDRPSYQVKPNQIITLSSTALKIPDVKKLLDSKPPTPKWLQTKGPVGKITRLPQKSDLDLTIDEQLIIEFYSR